MLNIVIYHKGEESAMLQYIQNNWKREEFIDHDDEGQPIEIVRGIRSDVIKVPIISVNVKKGAERVCIYTTKRRHSPVFTLEGQKAKQLTVLENYVAGLLKRQI